MNTTHVRKMMPEIAMDSTNLNANSDKIGELFSESEHTHGSGP
jgi:hypothetical protein